MRLAQSFANWAGRSVNQTFAGKNQSPAILRKLLRLTSKGLKAALRVSAATWTIRWEPSHEYQRAHRAFDSRRFARRASPGSVNSDRSRSRVGALAGCGWIGVHFEVSWRSNPEHQRSRHSVHER